MIRFLWMRIPMMRFLCIIIVCTLGEFCICKSFLFKCEMHFNFSCEAAIICAL
jgi:hypothetical protein